MKLYEKFEKLINEYDVTISKLSKELKIPYTTLDSIIKKKLSNISLDNAFKIANYFGVPLEYLAYEHNESYTKQKNINSTIYSINATDSVCGLIENYYQLNEEGQEKLLIYSDDLVSSNKYVNENPLKTYAPVLGQTAAGEPIEYNDCTPDLSMKEVPSGTDYVLQVRGDSMEPKISNCSFVFVHSQPDIESGQIGIVEIDGAVTCKKIVKINSQIVLHSLNIKYPPQVIKGGDFKILGKVIFNK